MGDDVLMFTAINRAIILPIVAGIALIVKIVTGVELSQEYQDILTDAVLAIVALAGIFIRPKKEETKKRP